MQAFPKVVRMKASPNGGSYLEGGLAEWEGREWYRCRRYETYCLHESMSLTVCCFRLGFITLKGAKILDVRPPLCETPLLSFWRLVKVPLLWSTAKPFDMLRCDLHEKQSSTLLFVDRSSAQIFSYKFDVGQKFSPHPTSLIELELIPSTKFCQNSFLTTRYHWQRIALHFQRSAHL